MIPSTVLALSVSIGAPPTDSDLHKRTQELVAQLGDRNYREREKAAKELLEIGYTAKEAVLAGQSNPDDEISERCRKLYPAIFRHDLEKRVAKFLDNPNESAADGLPGATRWLKTAGNTKESRELYAEMVKAHSEQLLNAELSPERIRDLYVELMREVYTRQRTNTAGGGIPVGQVALASEVLLFLFLGAIGETRTAIIPGISSTYYSQFLNSQFLMKKLSADPPATEVRKLFVAWLEKERYTIAMRRGLDIAGLYGIKECAPIALKIANELRVTVIYRAMALNAFSKLADKENIKDLDPFLSDKLQIATVVVNGERGSVQMRDVALGVAVQLAGQNLGHFGFERRPPAGANITTNSYTYFAFGTDEKREAAHAKWKEWATANLKK